MSVKVAVYAGTFDPIHNGHLDIIERCLPLFDEVLVAVLENEAKSPWFSVEERVEIIRQQVEGRSGIRVMTFSGLLVDFMERVGAQTVLRGLRAVSDFEYEFQMALMNRHLNSRVETVFMMPSQEYSYLSSRLVKEVFSLGGNLAGLVPDAVAARLAARLAERRGHPAR